MHLEPVPLRPAAVSSLAVVLVLAACGGGSGSSPTSLDPNPVAPTPAAPHVASTITRANPAAIDPTLAFRAVELPGDSAPFTVTKTVPNNGATVFTRHDDPASPPAPTDLDAMAARAAVLWTRRILTDGTHTVDFHVGGQGRCPSSYEVGCASAGGLDLPGPAYLQLQDYHLAEGARSDRRLTSLGLATLVHELGHTLAYEDERGEIHPLCQDHTTQVMCPVGGPGSPIAPNELDFQGIAAYWAIGPATDHQDFGLWATVAGVDGLAGFGIDLRRTLRIDSGATASRSAAADILTDTVTIDASVRGTPSGGLAGGLGTARWRGHFLGARSDTFQPVLGSAELTADLAALDSLALALTGLRRTDPGGTSHALADVRYQLREEADAWTDAEGRANARFYSDDGDPAAAAAGIVHDSARDLIGAWGALRD